MVGFFLMFVFVSTTVCWSAPVGERLTTANFILVSTAILSPLLAAGSIFGMLSAFGYNINSIMCMTPFLILGIGIFFIPGRQLQLTHLVQRLLEKTGNINYKKEILNYFTFVCVICQFQYYISNVADIIRTVHHFSGVDDAFLIIHSWRKHVHEGRMQQHLTVAQCMSAALRDVGPSISITSITNTLAFGIGALSSTPQIRMFCVCTALSVFADFILELCLFR
jgi:hypothetical protein